MKAPIMPLEDDSTTTLESQNPDNAAIELAARWNGPTCEKCESPMKSDAVSICRRCGWYSSLGRYVEIDCEWETDEDEPQAPAATPSHLEVWAKLLPPWAWVIIGTVAAVVVESIAVRLLTSAGSSARTIWSVAQLAVGFFAFLGCHLVNFLMVASEDTDFGILDLVIRPLKVWMRTLRNLPKRLVVTDMAAAGLTAAVMSIVVIGGLPYERLWDWGFKQPPKPNLLGAVASQVQKVEGKGADNLEDAVADFAATQNLDDLNGAKTPPAPAKPRLSVDCVILGYRVDGEGKLTGLVLATAYKGKLVYACSVTPSPTDDEVKSLVGRLEQVRSDQPYLPMQGGALWVKPVYACRVTCEKQEQSGRLIGASFKELLGRLQ